MIAVPDVRPLRRMRVRIHPSWSVAFILTVIVVITQFPESYVLWQRAAFGLAASVAFFVSICIRESVLTLVARSKGIRIKSLTLHAFGGVHDLDEAGTRPDLEILLGTSGLVLNLLMMTLFVMWHASVAAGSSVVINGILEWLTFIYFMLAIFHFIPGFPLDGGRVLRALLWKSNSDYHRATVISSWVGWGVGLVCILGGLASVIVARQWITGLPLTYMGVILLLAANAARRHAAFEGALNGVTARDCMTRNFTLVDAGASIGEIVRNHVLVAPQPYFVIGNNADFMGVATLHDVRRAARRWWDSKSARHLIRKAAHAGAVDAEQPAASVLERMKGLRIGHIPVVEGSDIIGLVARDDLVRMAHTRAHAKMRSREA